MNISDIRPYEKNAKKHTDEQLRKIAKSLKEFGWQQPIVVNKEGVIIVGHGRYMAYMKYPEGIQEPKIEVAELTEAQEKAYRLADNKLNESDWDIGSVIDDLKDMSPDLIEITGFGSEDISEMKDYVGGSNPDEKYKTDKEAPKEIIPGKEILEIGMWNILRKAEKIYVQFSGGKDSMAQVAALLENGIKADKMIIIHNSTPNDYPDLKEFVINFSKKIGARDCIIIGDYKDDDAKEIFQRNGFPLQHMVWCTSTWKIQPMRKFFKELAEKEDKSKVCICQGWRKEESERRENAGSITYDRNGFLLIRPIMDMKTSEVYDIIKKHGWELHHSYQYRGRLSCLYCFAIPRNEWDGMREKDPENFHRALELVCHGALSKNIKGDTFKNTIRKMMGMETMNKAVGV